MNKLRSANNKFKKGDHLTDTELDLLLAHYTALSQQLDAMSDPHYNLVQCDAWRRMDVLRGFRKARDGK